MNETGLLPHIIISENGHEQHFDGQSGTVDVASLSQGMPFPKPAEKLLAP